MYKVIIHSSVGEVLLDLSTLCDDVRFISGNHVRFRYKGKIVFTLDVSSLWLTAYGTLTLSHNPV